MNARKNIEEQVLQAVADTMGVSREGLKLDQRLIEDLGMDSLDQAELIIELEDDFFIDIPEDKADKIRTIKDIVDRIERIKFPENF